ncbi:MAG: hypothetical protein QNJ61_08985 [Desulfobacterales bacterium]|nr:hypothetical protein [Desulfobacterales bacterium]
MKIPSAWIIFIFTTLLIVVDHGRRQSVRPIKKEKPPMASEIKQTLQDVRRRLEQIKEYL